MIEICSRQDCRKPGGFVRDGVVFSASRELQAKGELSAAAAVLAAHLRANPGSGEEALALSRTYADAGHINSALEAADQLVIDHVPAGLRLRLGMQRLYLEMIQTSDVATSAKTADRLWGAFSGAAMSDAERADAEWTRCRILNEAARYREIGRKRSDEAVTALGVAAGTMLDHGWIDEGLRAALDLADCQAEAAPASRAYLIFADDARRLKRPDLAAAALLRHAERLIAAEGPVAEICEIISRARSCSAETGSELGGIDAAFAEATLRTRRLDGAQSELDDVLQAYHSHSVPRRSLAVTLELSSQARRCCDMEAARRYRQSADSISRTSGLSLERAAARLTEVQECIGAEDFMKALQLGNESLESRMPQLIRASVEAEMAGASALSHTASGVRNFCDASLRNFESLAEAELASPALETIAARSLGLDDEPLLRYLAAVLLRYASSDAQRDDHAAASRKHRLRTQLALKMHRLQQDTTSARLGEAESALAEAVADAERLHGSERAEAFGDIAKLSGQIAILSNDADRARRAYSNAIDIYDNAGRSDEAARCLVIAGSLHARSHAEALRRGQTQLARRHYDEAKAQFERVKAAPGIKIESARANRMLAQLELATEHHKSAANQNAALAYLEAAEAALDAARDRREGVPSAGARPSTRKAIAAESRQLYATAIRTLATAPADDTLLWEWHQKGRARALRDAIPYRAHDDAGAMLEKDLAQLIDGFRDLSARDWSHDPGARAERKRLMGEMHHHPGLAEYLEFVVGEAPRVDSVRATIDHVGGSHLAVFDYILSDDRIGLQGFTTEGPGASVWLRADAGLIRHLLEDWSNRQTLRRKLEGRNSPLRDIDALVEPLTRMTSEGDSIVLCPSGPLAALPLHAANVNGAPLLVRNTFSYASSVAMWRNASMRKRSGPETFNSVFADPLSEHPRQRIAGERLASRLGIPPRLGSAATRDRAIAALRHSAIVVFHGPILIDRVYPDRSKIVLSDGTLSAAEVSRLSLRTDLVVFGDCHDVGTFNDQSADVPGLAAALLGAGVRTVIMPLWPIDEGDAGDMLELFIHNIVAAPRTPASATLRRTQIQLMSLPAFASPYHWACWTAYGAI